MTAVLDLLQLVWDIFVHLDVHLTQWSVVLGPWLYVLLFAIIFCETGLVVTPFLPGDSLLFAVGALAALEGSPIRVGWILGLLIAAAVLGNTSNYAIGRRLGPKVFSREDSWLLNKRHLLQTQAFYEKHGGQTIIITRFMPIVRTFAPFVAGVGRMHYRRFTVFNVAGAVAWVAGFTLAGFWFGNLPGVKRHFQIVVLAIIVISLMPLVVEIVRSRLQRGRPVPRTENT